MITWPVCALILGLALIAALWDGLRRYAAARGMQAQFDERIKLHDQKLDLVKVNAEGAISELASDIGALKNGLGFRTTQARS